jgi:hypothetical protein
LPSDPPELAFRPENKTKGRPLGLLALWLQRGSAVYVDCCPDKDEHAALKAGLGSLGEASFYEDRKAARAALWALRAHNPMIIQLFMVEAQVPLALLGGVEHALWEPRRVF